MILVDIHLLIIHSRSTFESAALADIDIHDTAIRCPDGAFILVRPVCIGGNIIRDSLIRIRGGRFIVMAFRIEFQFFGIDCHFIAKEYRACRRIKRKRIRIDRRFCSFFQSCIDIRSDRLDAVKMRFGSRQDCRPVDILHAALQSERLPCFHLCRAGVADGNGLVDRLAVPGVALRICDTFQTDIFCAKRYR